MRHKKSVIIGFVHRIYASCSSWENIHSGLKEAKQILIENQYPKPLIEEMFNRTIRHILTGERHEKLEEELQLDANACIINIADKDKFLFFLNYRGKLSEKFATSLRKLNAPCKVIMTLTKTKQVVSSLKASVPRMLRSNVVYRITCPQCKLCYVGQTVRHLRQRYNEHTGKKGLIRQHFSGCGITPTDNDIEIIGTERGYKLLTLEALFIAEIKPELNTKDEYRSRQLKLKF